MTEIKVLLLGPPRVERAGVPVEFGTRKALALLAYLEVTRQPHSRESLTALLWPESDQTHARAALRSTLWALHKALGAEWLEVERETVSLSAASIPWLDVDVFRERLAGTRKHGHPADEVCPACLTALDEAVTLYRADFMTGFTLRDSPGFDEWCFFQTEGLRREVAVALEKLVSGHSAQKEVEHAIGFARRRLALDPLHEPTHRDLMRLYAWAGQRAAALRQYAEVKQLLSDELGAPLQESTTQLYEAIREDRLPPGSATAARLSGNLAVHVPPTPFVGREAELEQLARLLANPDCRLLTLVGPGGIGKSRLALQAAIQSGRTFEHGAYYIPLASVTSPEYIVTAITEALAVQFFGRQDPKSQLLNYLRAKTLLLVLDNFEHLRDGAELLTEILASAPQIKLLVTTRERLNAVHDWLFDLQGLSFPPEETPLAEAEQSEAVQLFLHNARRVHWNFALTEAERPGVLRICQLVEGMPLGVELAAAWVRVISCAEIAQEIERDLGFLATSLGGISERHRSLRAMFDYSWRRLPESARTVFAQLAVFRGGFGREAAVHVAGASLATLSTLVDHSFIHRTAVGRYTLHELLRQYADEKLRATAEAEAVLFRHSHYYAGFLQQQEPRLKSGGQREAIEAIGADLDNVRAAWRRAVEHRQAETIGQFLESLYLFLMLRSGFQEGDQSFRAAADKLEEAQHDLLLGAVLARQGGMAELLGQFERAKALLQKSLALLRQNPQAARPEIAFAVNELGIIAHRQGNYAEARLYLLESLTLYRTLEDPYGLSNVLNVLGNVTSDLAGQYQDARQFYEESLALRREIGDQRGVAASLNNLGALANTLGELVEAERLFHESIAAYQEVGQRYGLSLALNNFGYNAQLRGDYLEARRLYQDSLAIRREVGDRFAIALVLGNLGLTAMFLGEYAEAERLLRESLALHRAGHD
ncbi:MAG: ATP-binding protein, partial [Anaerolineales bacterium]